MGRYLQTLVGEEEVPDLEAITMVTVSGSGSLGAPAQNPAEWREIHLSVPKTRFSWDHGHLSRPVPSRGMPRPGGGLRVAVSADAVEQRQRHG